MDTSLSSHMIMEAREVVTAMSAVDFVASVDSVGDKLTRASRDRRTIFIAGNGGSWADADHFAAELRAQYEIKGRVALPAVALPISLTTLTAWGNDYPDGFETAMKRDLEAMGKADDILIGISTSGKAKNVRAALERAKELGLQTVAISGNGPQSADFGALADSTIVIPSTNTARIQEGYKIVIHILSAYIDQAGHNA